MAVTKDVSQLFDVLSLERDVDHLAASYAAATPFPHVVLDGLVQIRQSAVEAFPADDWAGWDPLGDTYQVKKAGCDDIARIPEPFKALIRELSEPRFLAVLERIVGIPKLIPDPYLTGGGLHLSGPGGVLIPHTDFHVYTALGLYRRVNVLIYFNPGWTEEDGGCLQLSAKNSQAVKTVVPTWGRCVIFTTDDRSVHGFPTPIVEGKSRRSIALYYYTSEEAPIFSGDATTHWQQHGQHRGVRRVRLSCYRALLQTSRGFSLLAHLVNPNQGLSWWRVRAERIRRRAHR